MGSSDDLIDRFVLVFRGRSDVYGNAKGFCVKEPLTKAVFEKHLTSTDPSKHIGVYCMIGELCSWGCIDIDGKDFALEVLCEETGEHECDGFHTEWDWQRMWTLARNLRNLLDAKSVPSHIERSKNGYHVWVFPEEPLVSAATMRRALLAACAAASYSPKEVNPKAEGPRAGTKGYGNFVRLPYGGALETYKDGQTSQVWTKQRYFVDDDQRRLNIYEALDKVDNRGRAAADKLEAIAKLWTPPPPPRTQVDYEAGQDAAEAVAKLNGLAYTIWLDGPLPGKDRSNTLAQLAHLCAECALTSSEAFAVLKSADERWGKFHLRDDCDDQLARMIQGAYE